MNDHIEGAGLTRQAIRTPRAAAVAGIAFSVLLAASFVLLRWALPSDPEDAGEWLTDGGRRDAVVLALSLLPFAGIAFLWFMGVLRDRIGAHEDRFFATVFLGSGLLFVAMLFTCGAVAGGLLLSYGETAGRPSAELWSFGRRHVGLAGGVRAAHGGRVHDLGHHHRRPSGAGPAMALGVRHGDRRVAAGDRRDRALDRDPLPAVGLRLQRAHPGRHLQLPTEWRLVTTR
jgi:MFS family permease